MTLVVGRLFSDGPRLLADSKLTLASTVANPYTGGALKAVILHPALCVAFAGGVMTAREAILGLNVSPGASFDTDEVCNELWRASRRASGVTDFLVATLAPERALIQIEGRGISRGHSATWIGDGLAYAEYARRLQTSGDIPSDQAVRHLAPRRRAELAEWNRMFPAFVQVIDDGRFETVEGLPVSVAPTSNGFRYESSAFLAADHEQTVRPEDGWVDADWGTAAHGAFGYAVKTPDDPGIGAIGAYFPHIRLGVLYYPARFLQPIIWREVRDDEFSEAVEHEFGITFGTKSLGFT
ncbi:MAG TPA: hypothetical protein VNB64_07745 [Solirubrobacteraceae bacterium]|nr:hypothetical protein [Solirubrobacteraceae bacterium]